MSRLAAVRNAVTSKAGRQVLVVQKHSPQILFVLGVAGVVGTVVLASRATLKMDEVIREAETTEEVMVELRREKPDKYSEESFKKDSTLNKYKTALKIGKLYALPFAIGVISIGALTGSHLIMRRRNLALSAAYGALDLGFREYRSRVVQEFGGEKDKEFRYGVVEREIGVETDEGVAMKTVKTPSGKHSIYARCFEKGSSKNWRSEASYNQMFLASQQEFANQRLRVKGHLFLNEVYDALGLERTPAGQAVGWVHGHGDSYVDFGIFEVDSYMGQQFVNGDEKSVWLDFNVDGEVWNLI